MTAVVIPFPLARRRGLILRQAAWYARQAPRAAERNLSHHLQVQRDTLLRKGVAPRAAEAEVAGLGAAIRSEVWRLNRSRGGEA